DIVNREARTVMDRNCVTSYIYSNRYKFKCETLTCPLPGMYKERWVLDTEDDYDLCKAIAHGINEGLATPTWLSIKKYLDDSPWLRDINKHHPRNERYYYALACED